VIYIKKIVISVICAVLFLAYIIITLYIYEQKESNNFVATLETTNVNATINYKGLKYVQCAKWGFDFYNTLGKLNTYKKGEKRSFFDYGDEVASIKGDDSENFISRQMWDGATLFCKPEINAKLQTVDYDNFNPTEITIKNGDKIVRLNNKQEILMITDLESIKGKVITFDNTSKSGQTYLIGYNPLNLPIYKPIGSIQYVDNKYVYAKYSNNEGILSKGYEIDRGVIDLLISKFSANKM
jgi:hypothetical protein